MKKLSFFLMAMLFSVMSFAQTTESVTLSNGSHDGSKITWTIANGNITISQLKAASTTAVNASYISAPRMYKGHILKFEGAEGYAITNIDITYDGSYYGTDLFAGTVISNNTVTKNTTDITATYSTTGGTHKIATTSAEGESMIALQIPNSAASGYKQLRPTAIKITYVKAATTTPNISCADVTFGTVNSINNNTKEIEVIGENLSEAIIATLETGTAFSVEGTLNANGGTLTVTVTATEEGQYTDNLILTAGTITKTVEVSAKVVTCQGSGTQEKPYTISDLAKLGNPGTKAWVIGYIIGEINNNELSTSGFANNSNIALADTKEETKKYAPIQLPSGNVRTDLNLVDNPSNLGKKVALYGSLDAYFSLPGVKGVSAYEWATTPVVNHTINVSANPAEAGTVTGGGEYEETDEITVKAVANKGYEFVCWTEGADTVSTEAEYGFVVLADRNLVANFKVAEPEYQLMEDEITNFVFDTDSWPMVCYGGPSEENAIEVYLVLTEAADGTLAIEDCSVSIMGYEATLIEGTLSDIDVYAPSANAVLRVECQGGYYELHLTMSAASAPVEPITIEINNATVAVEEHSMGFGDEVYYVLSMDATWSDGETTYPVSLETTEFDQTKDSQEVVATITVGGRGDDDPWLGSAEGEVTITVVNNVVTVAGLLENPYAWPAPVAFDFTISGTLPADGPATALDNIDTTVALVKAIENGQLIVIKNGVKYNALGQEIK